MFFFATKKSPKRKTSDIDLKRELEKRDVDSSSKNIDLQQKLRQALLEEGEDFEMHMLEFPGAVDISSLRDTNSLVDNS